MYLISVEGRQWVVGKFVALSMLVQVSVSRD